MKQVDKEKIKRLAGKHKVEVLLIYGSAAKGKMRKDSDIDVAFRSNVRVDFFELAADLAELLQFNKVDLVDLNKANPLLLSQIMDNCIKLYGSNRTVSELQIKSFNRLVDYAPYFEQESQFVKQVYNKVV